MMFIFPKLLGLGIDKLVENKTRVAPMVGTADRISLTFEMEQFLRLPGHQSLRWVIFPKTWMACSQALQYSCMGATNQIQIDADA
jgi:hypothetical protein